MPLIFVFQSRMQNLNYGPMSLSSIRNTQSRAGCSLPLWIQHTPSSQYAIAFYLLTSPRMRAEKQNDWELRQQNVFSTRPEYPSGEGQQYVQCLYPEWSEEQGDFCFSWAVAPRRGRWAVLFLPRLVNLKLLFLFHSCQRCFLKPISYSTHPSFSPGVHRLTIKPLRLTWNPLLQPAASPPRAGVDVYLGKIGFVKFLLEFDLWL